MLLLSNFTISLAWTISANWCCVLFWFSLASVDNICTWLNVALAAERFCALYFPLRHLYLFNFRITKIILAGVFLLAFVLAFPCLFYANISLSSFGLICTANLQGHSLIELLVYQTFISFSYPVPIAVSFMFTILLIVKLRLISKSHRFNEINGGVNVIRRQQLSACITITIISIVDLLLYIPFITATICMFITQQVYGAESPIAGFISILALTLFNVITAKRTLNLYIYLLRLPALRSRLCCRKSH